MKKLLLFAAVAGFGLVSASPPPKGPDNGPPEGRRHYPPCSRTVTDSCIQLYDRGVRARYERDDYGMDDRRGPPDDDAMGGHRRHRAMYVMDDPRRHGDGEARDDHRWCPEHRAHHGDHHGRAMAERRPAHRVAMAARATRVVGCRCAQPQRRHVAQRVRRAGERG